jgi:DNA polymerase-1
MTAKTKKQVVVLLDAHAIIHRAYHALPEFTSTSGEPTGALYGLSAMLIKIIQELSPDYVIACYDLPDPTYRHLVHEGYKAGRAKADDELVRQIIRSRDLFAAFGIPCYEKAGFEADDLLGTIVEQLKKKKNIDIIIASGDMDTLQLVSGERVQVYTLKKGIADTILYNEERVRERFGFGPELLPDYKGLRGDPSDNIIGIEGIGEKTATALITEFGSIEAMYMTLRKDRDAFVRAGIKPRVITLLEEHEEEAEFSKMLGTIRRDAPITFSIPSETWRDALDFGRIEALFSELNFRTLTQRMREVFGAPASEEATEEPREEVPEERLREAAIALWLLDSNITNPSLDDIFLYTKKKTFTDAAEELIRRLEAEGLEKVYREIELPLAPVIEDMCRRGVTIDRSYLRSLSEEYTQELRKLEKKIWDMAGKEFNINSPRQLGDILFDTLGLKVRNAKKTGTGARSTRESELEKMRDLHPIIEHVLAYRELQKLLSTYIDAIPKLLDKEGRLHTTFLQTGTTTGRMSSQNPNLQNIPIRTDLGRAIRNAFVAAEGFTLLALDYSQIELRIAAFLSNDPKLIDIFASGGDVHRAVAAQVFGVPPEKVDAEMRRRAKVINFGILYGMGVTALRVQLGTSREEAQRFFDEYFKTFSGIARYIEETKASAAKLGYTQTFFGRKRSFEGIRSPLPYVRAQAERMAFNAPIQGTEADIIKVAMVRVDRQLKEQGLRDDAHLLLQVHDELVYEVRQGQEHEIGALIKSIMESVLSLTQTKGVPILTEAKAGPTWGTLKPLT